MMAPREPYITEYFKAESKESKKRDVIIHNETENNAPMDSVFSRKSFD